jgi:hypothetical protein
VKLPNDFPDDERPTRPKQLTEAQEAADLVRDWKASPPEYRQMLLRLAAKGAKLPKAKASPFGTVSSGRKR